MANENNNINELAGDEDPTSELESPTWRKPDIVVERATLEVEASTMDFADVPSARIPDRQRRGQQKLHFELEQQAALLRGLKAESSAREEIIADLQTELDELRADAQRNKDNLKKSRESYREAKREIRERNEESRRLSRELDEQRASIAQYSDSIQSDQARLTELRSELSDRDEQIRKLQSELKQQVSENSDYGLDRLHKHELATMEAQLQRSARHADDLRQQLQELIARDEQRGDAEGHIKRNLDESRSLARRLKEQLDESQSEVDELRSDIELVAGRHTDEIRALRTALDSSNETLTQQQLINEQLASDLVDTRNFKQDLEQMLTDNEQTAQQTIKTLEKELHAARGRIEHAEEKLETKNDAINCLLAELAAKRAEIPAEPSGDVLVEEIEGYGSFSEPPVHLVDSDRVRRFLIGEVDGQEVQFPLFKGRVTIGRTQVNDIQLSADYISRRHAVIVTDGDVARIIDWGSRNGVRVNGARVTEHFLNSGDRVTIGTFDFVYEEKRRAD
ncbi:MAG: FHA domain-containing protein [Pseudomonadota bacterium]